MGKLIKILIALSIFLISTTYLATADMPTIIQNNYSRNITGPMAANNSTVLNFTNNNVEQLIMDVIPNNTDNYDAGAVFNDLFYQFKQFGAGDWFIVIIVGVLACTMLLSQNANPFLPAMVFMVGNTALWAVLSNHQDWLVFFSTVILVSLAFAFVGVLRGKG